MMKPTARSGASQDTTSLDPSRSTIGTHRDYLSHCARWSWAQRLVPKLLGEGRNRILDAGCGPNAPMAVELAVQPPIVDIATKTYAEYVGVDLNTIRPRTNPKWATYIGDFDFIERYAELGKFDMVVSFEVLEHMEEELQEGYMHAVSECMNDGAHLVFSTPVFNGHAAKNHIRELTEEQCRDMIERNGLTVVEQYGTFASWHDIKKELDPVTLALYERVREFHSDNLLACMLAPAFPHASRNIAWLCKK